MLICRFLPDWIVPVFACMGWCFSSPRNRYLEKRPCCSLVLFSGNYFRALALGMVKSFRTKCPIFGSRGCFGRFSKKPVSTTANEPSTRLKSQSKKSSVSEDFWSTSAAEMDNSTIQSQRSVSSTSGVSNQPSDPSSSSSNPPEFVNHGLLLWIQTRQQWLGNKKSEKRTEPREPAISWNATYESLLGANKPFPRPIPLPEMVDFLVDVWEEEGLYD